MRYIMFAIPGSSKDWEHNSYIGRAVCSTADGPVMGEFIEDPTFMFDVNASAYMIKLTVCVMCSKRCAENSKICQE